MSRELQGGSHGLWEQGPSGEDEDRAPRCTTCTATHGHLEDVATCTATHAHLEGVSAHSDQGARPLPRPWLRGGRASAYLRDQGQWLVPKVAPTLDMPLRDVTAEEINLSFHLLSAPSLSLSADHRASRSLSSRRGPGGHPRASPPIHPPDAKPAVRMRPRRIRG